MLSLKENIPALFSVDKFNQDNTTMNLNCDYYDLDEINNFDKLDSFLDNLLFSFDLISFSETWNSKYKIYFFDVGDIHGYQKYIGKTGTTLKSGCGVYISNKINFVPRPDLSTHFFNNKNEFETFWIEVINENKNNILLYVLVMSRTHFRVNPHSIFA